MELVSREITSQMLQQYPRGEQGNSRAWGAAQPRRPLTREQVWDKAGSHLRASPELEETLGQSLCGVYAVWVPSFPKPLPLRTVSPRSHTGFHVPQGWVEAASPHQRASPEALTCSWLCGRWVAFRTRTRPLSQAFPGSFTYHPKASLELLGLTCPTDRRNIAQFMTKTHMDGTLTSTPLWSTTFHAAQEQPIHLQSWDPRPRAACRLDVCLLWEPCPRVLQWPEDQPERILPKLPMSVAPWPWSPWAVTH